MSTADAGSELDLHDSEVNTLLQILAKLQLKYSDRKATFENLNSLSQEAMELAEEAGFLITVSIFDENMRPKMPPEITVHGRVDFSGYDPEKQVFEAKKGIDNEQEVREFLAKGGTSGQAVEINSEVTEAEKQTEE